MRQLHLAVLFAMFGACRNDRQAQAKGEGVVIPATIHELAAVGISLPRLRNGENRGRCPRCRKPGRDDALAVRVESDHATWFCHRCQWSGAIWANRSRDARPSAPAHDQNKLVLAGQLWRASGPLTNTRGADYLQGRGCLLPAPDADVRFHPSVMYWPQQRKLPALICRVSTVQGNCTAGVHRIYLDPAGGDKAVAKLRLGSCDEPVCIRLTPDDAITSVLAIAEGVESALAGVRIARSPVWSTVDAAQMAKFPVLAGVDSLTIFADHDRAGVLAAGECADRWRAAGRTVVALAPRRLGADVNDLVREARHG